MNSRSKSPNSRSFCCDAPRLASQSSVTSQYVRNCPGSIVCDPALKSQQQQLQSQHSHQNHHYQQQQASNRSQRVNSNSSAERRSYLSHQNSRKSIPPKTGAKLIDNSTNRNMKDINHSSSRDRFTNNSDRENMSGVANYSISEPVAAAETTQFSQQNKVNQQYSYEREAQRLGGDIYPRTSHHQGVQCEFNYPNQESNYYNNNNASSNNKAAIYPETRGNSNQTSVLPIWVNSFDYSQQNRLNQGSASNRRSDANIFEDDSFKQSGSGNNNNRIEDKLKQIVVKMDELKGRGDESYDQELLKVLSAAQQRGVNQNRLMFGYLWEENNSLLKVLANELYEVLIGLQVDATEPVKHPLAQFELGSSGVTRIIDNFQKRVKQLEEEVTALHGQTRVMASQLSAVESENASLRLKEKENQWNSNRLSSGGMMTAGKGDEGRLVGVYAQLSEMLEQSRISLEQERQDMLVEKAAWSKEIKEWQNTCASKDNQVKVLQKELKECAWLLEQSKVSITTLKQSAADARQEVTLLQEQQSKQEQKVEQNANDLSGVMAGGDQNSDIDNNDEEGSSEGERVRVHLLDRFQAQCNGRIQANEDLRVLGQMVLDALNVLLSEEALLPNAVAQLRDQIEVKRQAILEKMSEAQGDNAQIYDDFDSVQAILAQQDSSQGKKANAFKVFKMKDSLKDKKQLVLADDHRFMKSKGGRMSEDEGSRYMSRKASVRQDSARGGGRKASRFESQSENQQHSFIEDAFFENVESASYFNQQNEAITIQKNEFLHLVLAQAASIEQLLQSQQRE